MMRGCRAVVLVAAFSGALQGCGGAAGGSGDPGARPLPPGQSCGSIRSELNRLDSKGVPAQVERASNGGKLNATQRADVDKYNDLLNQYLGARCHV
ncbi:hypothetical protein [Hyphomicrobium sp.]|uniref:hypothetical protein n=1 Tax=Hyphomicrobium sp. TaxID=82 RepID=UPI0025C4F6EB|nr:hypothetical protein [Hyphomicrobium sp.]